MDDREYKVYQETRLRNLKREYAKVVRHSDLTDMALQLKSEISNIERDLNS